MQIDPAIQARLIEETRALLGRLQDPESQAQYTALLSAIEAGDIPDSLMEALGRLLELGLQTGRFHRVHGPYVEAALAQLYHQTPRGAAIVQATREANRALELLRGHTIEAITFTPRGPGHYRLVIETDQCRLTLETSQEGIWVKDIGIEV